MMSTKDTGIWIMLTLAALSLTGCSKLGEYKTSNTNAPSSPASTPAAAAGGQAGSEPTRTVPAPVSAGPALATSDGDKPGIRVEVVELKRTSGNTVNLKFAMINDSANDLSFGYDYGEGSTTDIGTVAGAHLIDAGGQKKYFVVRDTDGACLCSRGLHSIRPESRANLWAKCPAPPDDVQKITVVIPHFTPMDDVPISR